VDGEGKRVDGEGGGGLYLGWGLGTLLWFLSCAMVNFVLRLQTFIKTIGVDNGIVRDSLTCR
jgi:hypothetical protein